MTKAKANGQRVGYIRVSSVDQNTDRQLDGVRETLDEVFEDRASGKDTHRPALQAALKHLRRGDVLVVHSMDRLSRSLSDLLKLVEELTGRGVVVEFVKEGLTFTGDDSPMSKLMLGVMGAAAEFERGMIRERQREGIATAKASGKHLGRPAKVNAAMATQIRARIKAGESKLAVARAFGLSRPTVYGVLGA